MDAQKITANIGTIFAAMQRDAKPTPRFTQEADLARWNAESRAMEEAAQKSVAELIGGTLLAFQSIAQSLERIAAAQEQGKKPTSLLQQAQHRPVMPKLDD